MEMNFDFSNEQKLIILIASVDTKEKMLKLLEYMKKKKVGPEYFATALNKLALLDDETN